MEGVLLHAAALVAAFLETQSPVVVVGKGAGIVVDSRGYLVTCQHVVGGATHIPVRLRDGREVRGEVVVREPSSDLALVRLDADGRQFVAQRLASRPPQVRDAVTVVGHPRGFEHTVTTGVVSALGRELTLPDGRRLRNLFQTDAAISPGCSGGAVLDARGELIGTPAALYEGAAGVAFVIPVSTLKEFLDRHIP